MSTWLDINALISEEEAEEKRLRDELIAAGHDEVRIAEVASAIAASFQEPVTSEERERFDRIYQGAIVSAKAVGGGSNRRRRSLNPSAAKAIASPSHAAHEREHHPLTRGEVLGRKYRLSHRIGQGTMGAVWAAVNQDTSREVAIKFIPGASSDLLDRVLRLVYCPINHPNVLDILDVERTAGDEIFLVMELLSGKTLSQVLAHKRRLDPMEAARIALAVARALEAAHALGIVHRDLEPGNIFLHVVPGEVEPVVKVLNFDMVKNVAADDSMHDSLGNLVRSQAYMSPEQVSAVSTIDHRSDIWSLGILLFQMLSGVRPFMGESYRLLSKIVRGPIPTLLDTVRDADPRLSEIIARCLKRELNYRLESATELAELLEPIANLSPTEGSAAALPAHSEMDEWDGATLRFDPRAVLSLSSGQLFRAMSDFAGATPTEAEREHSPNAALDLAFEARVRSGNGERMAPRIDSSTTTPPTELKSSSFRSSNETLDALTERVPRYSSDQRRRMLSIVILIVLIACLLSALLYLAAVRSPAAQPVEVEPASLERRLLEP